MAARRRPKFEKEILPRIEALTPAQADYINCIGVYDQVVAYGPPGTGKTYVPTCHAADLLKAGKTKKLILTRPNIAAGRGLGYLPGELHEKYLPWLAPMIDTVEKRYGKGFVESQLGNNNIELIPFEYMRGRSFDDAFILLDEAQNTTPEELYLLLTRQGMNCKLSINGDIQQKDITGETGLGFLIDMVKKQGLPVPTIEFTMEDVVRSPNAKMWIKAYAKTGIERYGYKKG